MSGSDRSFVSGVHSGVGAGLEAAVRVKHWLRLRRLGWGHALAPPDDGPWAMGDPSPRDGCSLDVLVDGAEAFSSIAEAIERARSFVHVTGWHVAPSFALVRGERPAVVGQLLPAGAGRRGGREAGWGGRLGREFTLRAGKSARRW